MICSFNYNRNSGTVNSHVTSKKVPQASPNVPQKGQGGSLTTPTEKGTTQKGTLSYLTGTYVCTPVCFYVEKLITCIAYTFLHLHIFCLHF